MEKILRRVYSSKGASSALKMISHFAVIVYLASYLAMLVFSYMREPLFALRLVLAGAIPFIIVSLLRRVINAPRPYELYDFYEIYPKQKQGRSFPSRHVFSAFTVATLAYSFSLWCFLALLLLGLVLATVRVLLGMHFVRDVVAGALIGVLSGILGIIIIF